MNNENQNTEQEGVHAQEATTEAQHAFYEVSIKDRLNAIVEEAAQKGILMYAALRFNNGVRVCGVQPPEDMNPTESWVLGYAVLSSQVVGLPVPGGMGGIMAAMVMQGEPEPELSDEEIALREELRAIIDLPATERLREVLTKLGIPERHLPPIGVTVEDWKEQCPCENCTGRRRAESAHQN